MKQHVTILILAVIALMSTGCYTQFALIDQTPPPQEEVTEWVVDSATGDTVMVPRQVDTVVVEDNQTCVWERDLMGYPRLRCYDSFYPRDWFRYNNSPWWYRNDPYWYDYNRCPRYYYYDPGCGCCRYTGTSYDARSRRPGRRRNTTRSGDQDNSSVRPGGGSTIYPRVRGVPDPRGTKPASSSSTTPGSSKSATVKDSARRSGQIIIDRKNTSQPHVTTRRSAGVPSPKKTRVVTTPKPQQGTPGKTASVPKTPSSGSSVSSPPSGSSQSSGDSSSGSTTQSPPSKKRKRRNPRSWK